MGMSRTCVFSLQFLLQAAEGAKNAHVFFKGETRVEYVICLMIFSTYLSKITVQSQVTEIQSEFVLKYML